MKTRVSLGAFALASLLSASAHALPVQFDVQGITGYWGVDVLPDRTGPATLDLAPGTHTVRIGYPGAFQITVGADGTVSTTATASASVAGSTVTFRTSSLSIDTADYTGNWHIDRFGPTNRYGSGQILLVSGLQYALRPGSGSGILFSLDASGVVSSGSPASAVGAGDVLTLLTSPVTIDPGAYTGYWTLPGIVDWTNAGTAVSFHAIRGLRYRVIVAWPSDFFFDVSASGVVTSVNPTAAVGSGSTLSFRTAPLHVDMGSFAGPWRLVGVSDAGLHGSGDFHVVKGLRYAIEAGAWPPVAQFTVDDGGAATIDPAYSVSALSIPGGVQIQSYPVTFDPGSYTGLWDVENSLGAPNIASNLQGRATLHLIPGRDHFVVTSGGYASFPMTSSCSVPATLAVGSSVFSLSCGQPDSDGDGVADDADNCPAVPNEQQVDQDLDGLGDECDGDKDGDGVDNAADNCPAIANADQANLDGDASGDVCDDDDDGDFVNDGGDNCVGLANPAQSDSDGDGQGDACDSDDDGDGVPDASDNCPLVANANQANWDGDPSGDACDSDDDGDSIPDTADTCPATPVGTVVNGAGCGGYQLVERTCVPGTFPNHGQYVRCVAQTANAAKDAGLLTDAERARIVALAAKK